jgi:hypothetical protein
VFRQLFETPEEVRKLWDPHSVNGWYIGTSFKHYRNSKVYCKKTNAERILDTVWFRHKYLTNPSLTAADHIVNAAAKLTEALKNKPPAQVETSAASSLSKLVKIFNQAAIKYSEKEAAKNARLPGVGSSKQTARNDEATAGMPNLRTPAAIRAQVASPGVPVSKITRNTATR